MSAQAGKHAKKTSRGGTLRPVLSSYVGKMFEKVAEQHYLVWNWQRPSPSAIPGLIIQVRALPGHRNCKCLLGDQYYFKAHADAYGPWPVHVTVETHFLERFLVDVNPYPGQRSAIISYGWKKL